MGRVGSVRSSHWPSIAISRNPKKGTGAAFAIGVTREQALAAHARAACRTCARFAMPPTPTLPPCCTKRCASACDRYEERKQEAGSLDFLDLLIKARDLVCDNAEVCREFRERFRVILVDEFQDTDPLQAELLLCSPATTAARFGPARSSSSAIPSSRSIGFAAPTSAPIDALPIDLARAAPLP